MASKGTFYVVGVGPGDPQLITLKAVAILEKCRSWLAPAARDNGESTALNIVSRTVSPLDRNILILHFPMKKVPGGRETDPEVLRAWNRAADWVAAQLEKGMDVALPTLGDPAIYCTGFYVYKTLLAAGQELDITIIPGISALGATAAAAKTPLCLGDDELVVIPAVFENRKLRRALEDYQTVVFMKVHNSLGRLVPVLKELGLLEKAVLVERASMAEQRVHHDVESLLGRKIHYFSTLIVRK